MHGEVTVAQPLRVVAVVGDGTHVEIARERILQQGNVVVIDPPPPAGQMIIDRKVIAGAHDALDRMDVPPKGRVLMVNGGRQQIDNPRVLTEREIKYLDLIKDANRACPVGEINTPSARRTAKKARKKYRRGQTKNVAAAGGNEVLV